MTFTVQCDVSGLLSNLSAMSAEVDQSTRPAAQAGAEVLYQQVRANVAGIGRVSGNLASSIYQAYSPDNSGPGRAEYHVSWNHRKAPHGHLLEYGYLKRYASYVGKDGRWHTAVRPSQRGKKPPKRRASIAAKDRYYVRLPGGPRHIAARPFVRPAAAAFDRATAAARRELFARMQRFF